MCWFTAVRLFVCLFAWLLACSFAYSLVRLLVFVVCLFVWFVCSLVCLGDRLLICLFVCLLGLCVCLFFVGLFVFRLLVCLLDRVF